MRNTTKTWGAACLAGMGLGMSPMGAWAQEAGGPPPTGGAVSSQRLNLDLESTNLYTGLKVLFGHIKANFALDPSLKTAEVTVHLHDVPFRVALETLLKSSGLPLTYRFENEVYTIVPRVDDPGPTAPEAVSGPDFGGPNDADTNRIIKIYSNELTYSAIDIVTALGGTVVRVGNSGNIGNGFGSGGMAGGLGGQSGFGGGQGGLGGGLGGFSGQGGLGSGSGGLGGGLGGFGGSGSGGFGSGGRF